MAAIGRKEKRNVLPRWRSFNETLAFGELNTFSKETAQLSSSQLDLFRSRISDWERSRSLWTAIDLVGASLALDRTDDAEAAAQFILNDKSSPGPARAIAERLLRKEPTVAAAERIISAQDNLKEISALIHEKRERLAKHPRNAIEWIELARQYTVLGLHRQAKRAMSVAVGLNRTNRFVLRAAARFYVHIDEPDRAHALLQQAPSISNDPWLIATEMAVAAAAARTPRFVRDGRRLIADPNYNALELSEVASELATLELQHGSPRAAKKLFKVSLQSPNDNTLAQAQWASHSAGINVVVENFDVPRRFEADAWNAFNLGQWQTAFDSAESWLSDQPFSSRPTLLASYIQSSIYQNYKGAADLLQRSLLPNPCDATLLNNLAFSYGNLGELNKAQRFLDHAKANTLDSSGRILVTATQGFIYYRSGQIELGRDSYLAAVELAAKDKNRDLYVRALIHLAFEELRACTADAIEVAKRALDESRHVERTPELSVLLERLEGIIRKRGVEVLPSHTGSGSHTLPM